MTRWTLFLLTLSIGTGLRGQDMVTIEPRDRVEGWYTVMARELPNRGCTDSGCSWTLEHLLTYYGVALNKDGLKGALRDARADVRSMAADELVKTEGRAAIPWLADALSSERAAGTRLHVANSLAQFGDERGVQALENLCKSGGQSEPGAEASVRLYASESLLQLHKATCNNCAIDLLRSLDRPGAPREFAIRAAALAVATDFESATQDQAAAIRQIAERWISDEDDSVRRVAGRALALYGDAASYQKLKAALAVEKEPMARDSMQEELRRMAGRLGGTVEK